MITIVITFIVGVVAGIFIYKILVHSKIEKSLQSLIKSQHSVSESYPLVKERDLSNNLNHFQKWQLSYDIYCWQIKTLNILKSKI